jgi:hypothetical protein
MTEGMTLAASGHAVSGAGWALFRVVSPASRDQLTVLPDNGSGASGGDSLECHGRLLKPLMARAAPSPLVAGCPFANSLFKP